MDLAELGSYIREVHMYGWYSSRIVDALLNEDAAFVSMIEEFIPNLLKIDLETTLCDYASGKLPAVELGKIILKIDPLNENVFNIIQYIDRSFEYWDQVIRDRDNEHDCHGCKYC